MNSNNSRRAAAYVIARWILTKEFPASLLPDGKDRAFVQDLVYTTIRRFRPLRKILGELVRQWPKGELEALLYVGAAQILYMDDVPDFAAVNETVDAAKACGNPRVAKVVNGVLRNLVRRRAEFAAQLQAAPVAERESYPGELYRRWVARFGAADAERLAVWHNQPAETYLARRDGSFVTLARGLRVEDVPGFTEGAFIVQDPGTALAIELLDPKPGETVLDACAAPGGKTVQIAWRGAAVTACEVNPRRRRRLEENLRRLRLDVAVVPELPPLPEDRARHRTSDSSTRFSWTRRAPTRACCGGGLTRVGTGRRRSWRRSSGFRRRSSTPARGASRPAACSSIPPARTSPRKTSARSRRSSRATPRSRCGSRRSRFPSKAATTARSRPLWSAPRGLKML